MASQRIEIWYKPGVLDAGAAELGKDIQDLGIRNVDRLEVGVIYRLDGQAKPTELDRIARELFADSITQVYCRGRRRRRPGIEEVEVFYKEGVTDTVGETALKGIRDLGIKSVKKVATGRRYFLAGRGLDRAETERIARHLLANEVIQVCHFAGGRTKTKKSAPERI
ncbi:MAG TPA: phosphoribosylformylglycinamidine synthase subunit PurS [bacterium]|uniref:Phosphoribosylformylglycinamidine synthase n=1 Tax=candidate division TA06 bacterium ADurb.Bin417 TaxID=1852828 RepID=A0A1V5MK25_UNCT6|nr:MAG: phosphoribosylformylglycinamidine synthase [candidate division TA06 bacterium ADurb.Bin417]HNQ34723.1 phosphoribosylformylglycinamidine synthase subunit PurS [bacterium]HNS48657.1 phosphoribosylformylglycinamidine synthase subunit PurS [bacterium]